MSKIIIHNLNPLINNATAAQMVVTVMSNGFVSGERQYCFATRFNELNSDVIAMKTKGNTHTFKIYEAAK